MDKKAINAALDRYSEVPLGKRLEDFRELAKTYNIDKVINPKGQNALAMASSGFVHRNGPAEIEMVKLIVELGANVNFITKHKRSVLDGALHPNDENEEAIVSSVKVASYLYEKGARFSEESQKHLFTCCDIRAFRFYLEHSKGRGVIDELGNNLLHAVVKSQRIELVKEVLSKETMSQANNDGLTPLGVARGEYPRARINEIIALLEENGAPESVALKASDDSFLLPAKRFKELADSVTQRARGLFESPPPTGQNLAQKMHNWCYEETLSVMKQLKVALTENEAKAKTLLGDQTYKKRFFHHGDLTIEGNLNVVAPFWVTGTLCVSGDIADCGPDSTVVVGEDVRCQSLWTSGEFHVAGDLHAKTEVEGNYNDNTLIATTIFAQKVIYNDHCILGEVKKPETN